MLEALENPRVCVRGAAVAASFQPTAGDRRGSGSSTPGRVVSGIADVHNVPVRPSEEQMTPRFVRWLLIAGFIAGVAAAPAPLLAGPWSESLVDLGPERGVAVGVGLGVSPLRWDSIAPPAIGSSGKAAESVTLNDLEQRAAAMSFDVKLKWPRAESTSTPFEPYLLLGPALILDRTSESGHLALTPADPVLRLGTKAGAGFNWRLSKEATLFGAYDVTSAGIGGLGGPGAKTPGGNGVTGYDVMYGIRFSY
jgi:hypothetical protein